MLIGPRKPEKLAVRTIERQRVVPSWMREPQTTCTGRHRRVYTYQKAKSEYIRPIFYAMTHFFKQKSLRFRRIKDEHTTGVSILMTV